MLILGRKKMFKKRRDKQGKRFEEAARADMKFDGTTRPRGFEIGTLKSQTN